MSAVIARTHYILSRRRGCLLVHAPLKINTQLFTAKYLFNALLFQTKGSRRTVPFHMRFRIEGGFFVQDLSAGGRLSTGNQHFSACSENACISKGEGICLRGKLREYTLVKPDRAGKLQDSKHYPELKRGPFTAQTQLHSSFGPRPYDQAASKSLVRWEMMTRRGKERDQRAKKQRGWETRTELETWDIKAGLDSWRHAPRGKYSTLPILPPIFHQAIINDKLHGILAKKVTQWRNGTTTATTTLLLPKPKIHSTDTTHQRKINSRSKSLSP